MAKERLTEQEKRFLIECFAFYDSLTTASKKLERQFGKSLSRQTIWRYDLSKEDNRRELSQKNVALFDELRAKFNERVGQVEIAQRAKRIERLNQRWLAIDDLINARALAYEDFVGGGETGLLAITQKSIREGESTVTIDEGSFDAALIKEERELAKQAAVELGQWEEKHAVQVTPKMVIGVPIEDV